MNVCCLNSETIHTIVPFLKWLYELFRLSSVQTWATWFIFLNRDLTEYDFSINKNEMNKQLTILFIN